MNKLWFLEVHKCFWICVSGGLLGWSLGFPWAAAFIALAFYTIWLLLYLRELSTWLEKPGDTMAPKASGLWEKIFDHLRLEKRKLKNANKRLKKTIEISRLSTNALRDAVVLINDDNTLEWSNKAAKHYLGLYRRSDRHHSITYLLRNPEFIAYFNRGEYLNGINIPSPGDPDIHLHITVSFYHREKRILIARDVTHLHHLEQMRQDFVANVSHELRTPLTVIKGYIETFLSMLSPTDNPGLHRGLSQVEQQTLRMEALVNDLLQLSRLETDASRTPHDTVDVVSLLQQIYHDAEAINQKKQHQITLTLECDTALLGNSNELNSAFSNIIFNAIRHTPKQGIIDIRWWTDRNGAYLCVSDNGAGIDPIHIPRLTERFYRADPSRHSQSGGTGLGLAIAKHCLRHHNARLEIESSVGDGSAFTCHFPKRQVINTENAENN